MFSNSRGGRWAVPAAAALAAALVLAGCHADPAASTTTTSTAAGLDVSPSALALQQQFVKVVKQVGPSVVLIRTSEGLGSGIVFDAKGDCRGAATGAGCDAARPPEGDPRGEGCFTAHRNK